MVQTKSSSQIVSNAQKRKGFHGKYLSVCKSKNLNPLNEVKKKQKNYQELDFHADRLRVQDWLAVCKSLHSDKTLKFAAIRLRKNNEQGEYRHWMFKERKNDFLILRSPR